MRPRKRSFRAKRRGVFELAVLAALICALRAGAQQQPDWQQQVREHIAARELTAALAITDRRLAEAPVDLEARGWRARLLAWFGQLQDAEAEYRRVLAAAPNDADILSGLADVLARQQRFEEALALLVRARELAPSRPDILIRRGRVLRSLGRAPEARQEFLAALTLDPQNQEARAGLASLTVEPRHEFRIGTDIDFFNYANNAPAETISLRSEWGSRWITSFAGNFYQRFGESASKFAGSATYRLTHHDGLTAGGATGRDRGVISKGEAFFEYGHGFPISRAHFVRGVSRAHFVRGIETTYHQHWLWFDAARVMTLSGSMTFYLPCDWTWSLAVTGARSRFSGAPGAEWRPSGITRLSFPLHRHLTANLFYAVGTENFARVDQIGRFSARTWGGGLRYRLTSRQDITGYVFSQDRSQGRTQTTFGLSYGFRF